MISPPNPTTNRLPGYLTVDELLNMPLQASEPKTYIRGMVSVSVDT
ncbi:MAG TPA: hypothetical protein VGK19_24880 [Capsulimonadaceae bacterium]